jgi:hypothetical protein
MEQYYAVYKGDKFLFLGTVEECGTYLGIKPASVKFHTTPVYQRRVKGIYEERLIIIKIEDGD